jgi:hypothetical protein
MKKSLLALLIIGLIPFTVMAQSSYYVLDTAKNVGKKLIDGGDLSNCKFCLLETDNKKIIQYTPKEVYRYGFEDGREYYAKDIEINGSIERVFIEKLSSGKITLFYYKGIKEKLFFIEKDSLSFTKIPKIDGKEKKYFRTRLKDQMSDCVNVSNALKLVSYNKKSMTKLVDFYNNCTSKPFPFFKYGVTFGYEINKLKPASNLLYGFLNQINYRENGSFSAGLFFDYPILLSSFSIHPNLYYTKHSYSYLSHTAEKDLDLMINESSLKLSIMVRYTMPFKALRPFVNAGPLVSYCLRNEMNGYYVLNSDNVHEINKFIFPSSINQNQWGYCVGGGIEVPVTYRNSLFFEGSYYVLNGLKPRTAINSSGTLLTTSFNF